MDTEMLPCDDPFRILRHEHATLGQLFLLHQEMLVNRAWARAARLLSRYRQQLARHIRIEEQLLLPYCGDATPDATRWDAQVYVAEHRRLEELVGNAAARLTVIRRRGVTPAMLIKLLDQEKTVKHLMQHHHEREARGLFDELRRHLPATARQQLLAALLENNPAPAA
jgi:hemerythrin-like domain-containing protein